MLMSKASIIQDASFSKKIKTYILLTVSFFLLITIIGIPVLIVWLLGFGQYVSRKYYDNLKCQLTNRHLIFSKGAFFKVEKTIPLENIQDLTFLQNPILNLLELRVNSSKIGVMFINESRKISEMSVGLCDICNLFKFRND